MNNKTRSWTPQRRAKQAERCRKTCPSKHSTGPKTASGKCKVAQNALKHGFFSCEMERLKSLMSKQRKRLKWFL